MFVYMKILNPCEGRIRNFRLYLVFIYSETYDDKY